MHNPPSIAKPASFPNRVLTGFSVARTQFEEEGIRFGMTLLFFVLLFILLFLNESFSVILRTIGSIFLFLVLPGYLFLLPYRARLGFTERMIVGTMAVIAGLGVFGYVLGLLGIGFRISLVLVPLAFCAFGIWNAGNPGSQNNTKEQESLPPT